MSHSYTQPGQLNHCYITHTVAHSNHFLTLHIQHLQQSTQRIGFVDGAGNYFQKIWLRTEYVQRSVQSSLPVIFQTNQCFFVIAHQHTLTRSKINGSRKFFFFNYLQVIQPGFILDMFIFRRIRYDRIIMISE